MASLRRFGAGLAIGALDLRPPALTPPCTGDPTVMNDTPAVAPPPVVFTDAGTSCLETTLATVAIEKAAHALDWALRGDAAGNAPRWVRVIRAAVLTSSDAEAALRAEGVPAPAARALLERLAACATLGADHQWLGIAGAIGVPDRERPILGTLGQLALGAANTLARADALERLPIASLATPVTGAARGGAGEQRLWACILATRLDAPGVLEGELLDLLGVATHALIDRHAGFDDWLPRPHDPTVRVRLPAEHPGLPLAFCPFVATRRAALDALDDGPLLDEVLELVEGAFNASQVALSRTPQ